MEVDILGTGILQGKEIIILGEGKSQFTNKEINKLLKKGEIVKKTLGKDVFLIGVCYTAPPGVINYARTKNVCIYTSDVFPI